MHGLDLVLFCLIVVPIWTVAMIVGFLEVRDGVRTKLAERRARKLIQSLDLDEPQGRSRLGLRQEEE